MKIFEFHYATTYIALEDQMIKSLLLVRSKKNLHKIFLSPMRNSLLQPSTENIKIQGTGKWKNNVLRMN